MDIEILLKTLLPLLLLIGLGYLSRRTRVLKGGDERVLNAYLYYFALPALFIIDLSEQSFTTKVVNFVFGSIIPVIIMLGVYVVFLILFHSSKNTVYLTTLSTIFGSTVFFGIPFISFAFPSREAEYLATLSAASIGLISVPVSMTILEFYRLGNVSKWNKMKQVTRILSFLIFHIDHRWRIFLNAAQSGDASVPQ